jgi:Domain of unknown function (DUF4351)
MTQVPHDQFAKNLLESLLAPCGQVTTALTIDSEVREIDVYFVPTNNSSRIADLGLLARCATKPALWFRLLGKGKVQQQAISEIAALPVDSPYRADALKLFGNLRVILDAQKSKKTEEQELIMQLSPLYLEQIQAAEERGEQLGERKEGQVLILRQLKRRMGDISPQTQETIKKLPLEKLEDLGEALLDFAGIEDLTDWLDTNC